MLLGFTTLFITEFPAKNSAVSCISSYLQTKRSSDNEVKCLRLISMGKILLLLCTLILKIVDTNYVNF